MVNKSLLSTKKYQRTLEQALNPYFDKVNTYIADILEKRNSEDSGFFSEVIALPNNDGYLVAKDFSNGKLSDFPDIGFSLFDKGGNLKSIGHYMGKDYGIQFDTHISLADRLGLKTFATRFTYRTYQSYLKDYGQAMVINAMNKDSLPVLPKEIEIDGQELNQMASKLSKVTSENERLKIDPETSHRDMRYLIDHIAIEVHRNKIILKIDSDYINKHSLEDADQLNPDLPEETMFLYENLESKFDISHPVSATDIKNVLLAKLAKIKDVYQPLLTVKTARTLSPDLKLSPAQPFDFKKVSLEEPEQVEDRTVSR